MKNARIAALGTETKIFDPRDFSTGSHGAELVDASVVNRQGQWWMYLAGQSHGHGATDLYSASLPRGTPLSSTGWKVTRDEKGELSPVGGRSLSSAWDGRGGRHCPSYVKGWNPVKGEAVERIYYAGSTENLWGPYTIGFLQWDGQQWVDQPEPAFAANEEWEHGSVYEPNLVFHDGRWKMWYVAGSNQENYIAQGYAESKDGKGGKGGKGGWSRHSLFAPPEMKMFDFCIRQRADAFDAVFARVSLKEGIHPAETGLWWCRSRTPSGRLADWSRPIQIMTAESCEWHSGPWKPSLQFRDQVAERAFVFFNGSYRTSDPGPFPFAFTLGCLEIDLPLSSVSNTKGDRPPSISG